jgi:hypothetical protein
VTYHCHDEDIPIKLLFEVPITLQDESVIAVVLDTLYSTMARDALNAKYEGVQRASFLEGLQIPCSYGMVVLKPEGLSNCMVLLAVSVTESKFIIIIQY